VLFDREKEEEETRFFGKNLVSSNHTRKEHKEQWL